VPPHNPQKICLDQEYPCPCHLKGKLRQIVLTEAFGCDRCHRIFVMQADNLTIEELATNYPYKRRYYWDGNRFQIYRPFSKGMLGMFDRSSERWALWLQCLGVIALVLVLIRLYSRVTLTMPIFKLVLSIAMAIVVLSAIAIWLFDRG
jgi:hypothetical protein